MMISIEQNDVRSRLLRDYFRVHMEKPTMKASAHVISLFTLGILAALMLGVCGCDRPGDATSSAVVRAAAPTTNDTKGNTPKKRASVNAATIVQRALAAKEDLERELDTLEKRTEDEGATARDFYQLGKTLFRMRQHARPELKLPYDANAIDAFEKAHALSGEKGFARALIGAARVHLRVNNLVDGMRYLEKAAAVDPKDIRVRAGLARLQAYRSGDWTATIKTMEQLVTEPEGRESPTLWSGLGYAYHQAGRLQDAERAYRKRIELDPTQVGVWINLGSVLDRQGRVAESRDAYNVMRAVDPTNGYATHNLAIQLVRTGDPKDARRAIELVVAMLEVEPGFPAAWGNLGQAYLIVGECKNAVNTYQMAATALLLDVETWNNLGLTHFKCGDYERAVEAHIKAREIDPNNTRTLYNLGNAYAHAGRYPESASTFRRAGELNPKDSRIWNNLGTVLMNQDQYEQAADAYKTALSQNPNNENALQNVVLAYVALQDASSAVTVIDKLLAKTPPRPKIYCERATARFHMREIARAVEDCNHALRLDAKFAQAYWLRGVLHLADGRYVDAIQDLERSARDRRYAAYAAVYSWIAQARKTTQGESVAPPRWVAGEKFPDPWESAMVAFVNGDINSESFLNSARNDGQKCEAYFYIAERVRHEVGPEAARTWYERCVKTGESGFFEFRLATWELGDTKP